MAAMLDGFDKVNVGAGERVASTFAGAAMIGYGLTQRSWRGLALGMAGSAWIYRGLSGRSPLYRLLGVGRRRGREVNLQHSITVQRPRHEVYAFWRNFRNHPRFMHRLESVEPMGDHQTRWRAKGPLGRQVEWISVVQIDRPDELIRWATLGASPFEHWGEVRFFDAPYGRGTEVQVQLHYRPVGGRGAVMLARLLGDEPGALLAEELRRFRQLLEAGEIASVAGQPHWRRSWAGKAMVSRLEEEVR